MSEKRKDNKGRILRTGESQRKDLIYQYRYTDIHGKWQTVYSSDLKKFWCYNIEPPEYEASSFKEYKETPQLISRNKEKLSATMTDAQKEFQSMAECLLFQNSFRLGAKIMLEVMDEIRI